MNKLPKNVFPKYYGFIKQLLITFYINLSLYICMKFMEEINILEIMIMYSIINWRAVKFVCVVLWTWLKVIVWYRNICNLCCAYSPLCKKMSEFCLLSRLKFLLVSLLESVYAIRSQSIGCLFKSDSGLNLTIVSSKVTVFPDFQVFHTVNKLSKNFKLELCFIPSRVASLQVVKSTAYSVPPN